MNQNIMEVCVVFNQGITSLTLPDTYMYRPTTQTTTGTSFSLFADAYFQNQVLGLANYYALV